MDVSIKKVSERGGKDRFVLVKTKAREVITANDVSEATLRKFFRGRGVSEELVDRCLDRARDRYAEANKPGKVDEGSETLQDDDLLFELGLSDEDTK